MMIAPNRFSDNDQDPWSINWDEIIQGDKNTDTNNNKRRKVSSSQNEGVAGVVGTAAPTLAPEHVHPHCLHYHHPHYHHYPHQKQRLVAATCNTQDSSTPSLSPPFALVPNPNYTNHPSFNQEQKWSMRFEELKTFFLAHGHSDVPVVYTDNPSLGRWCSTQRGRYRRYLKLTHQSKNDSTAGRRSKITPLTKEKIDKLHTVAFKFGTLGIREIKFEQKWSMRLEELKAFFLAHGHSDVPMAYTDNIALGRWCSAQRVRYREYLKLTRQSKNDSTSYKRSKTSPLTKEKIDKLHTVAFKFDIKRR